MEFRQAQLQRKIAKVQEACRKKLEEVHSGYQVVSLKHPEPTSESCVSARDALRLWVFSRERMPEIHQKQFAG
jgi:hypothetical protein